MSKPLTMKGPCVVCGATDYAESCGEDWPFYDDDKLAAWRAWK